MENDLLRDGNFVSANFASVVDKIEVLYAGNVELFLREHEKFKQKLYKRGSVNNPGRLAMEVSDEGKDFLYSLQDRSYDNLDQYNADTISIRVRGNKI